MSNLYIAVIPTENYSKRTNLALGLQIFGLDEKLISQSVSTLGSNHSEFEFYVPRGTKFKLSLEESIPELPFGLNAEWTKLIRSGEQFSGTEVGPFVDVVLFSTGDFENDYEYEEEAVVEESFDAR
jgi:hypothetical protein